MQIGQLTIIPGSREVFLGGEPVSLTSTEFHVLLLLANRPGQTFSRRQIIDAVQGEDYAATDRTVDVQVFALRNKLGDCGGLIETVRGVGYRFR